MHTDAPVGQWVPYPTPISTPGELWLFRDLYSPQLANHRNLVLYLAPGVDRQQPITILYGQDGQNLFDEATSYAGSWRAAEAAFRVSGRKRQLALVGIAHGGRQRFFEYTPLVPRPDGPPGADRYLHFVADQVLDTVEAGFGLQTDPRHRGVFGSSLGGLFSLYAFFSRPDLFGLCGAFSPSLQVAADRFFPYVELSPRPTDQLGRIYLDVGTREVSRPRRHFNSRHYGANVTAMRNLLRRKGYRDGQNLRFVRAVRAVHHESAWARRLPPALEFLTRD